MSFDLPNELWTEIFEYIPPTALVGVHLTARRFYALSHPILFRFLVLDPDHHAKKGNRNFLGILDAYTEPHVAKRVHRLAVSFLFRRLTRSQRSSGKVIPLKDAMLQRLPAFTNLRVLSCIFRSGEQVDLGSLALPTLQKLTLSGCALICPAEVPAEKLHIEHFAYTDIPIMGVRNRDTPFFRSFLSALDPAALKSLTLSPAFDSSPGAWLALDEDLYASFTSLRTVDITCDGPFLNPVRAFLAALPALEDLTLHGRSRNAREPTLDSAFGTLPSDTMRSLRSFSGPVEYLPLVLPHAPKLASLAITSGHCFCVLRRTLAQVPKTIRQLEFLIGMGVVHEWVDEPELTSAHSHLVREMLEAHFPRLERLTVRMSDDDRIDPENDEVFGVISRDFEEQVGAALKSILVPAAEQGLKEMVVDFDVHEITAAMLPDLEPLQEELLAAVKPRGVDVQFVGNVRDLDEE
ncbi:F-box domain-containing protein [Mycena kentingensis (nom. inval.)]|nr:F-box domain-containing protein [Mycena kentingensis (nom. inval.)]